MNEEYNISLVSSTEPSDNLTQQEEALAGWVTWCRKHPTEANFAMARYYLTVIINIRIDRIKRDHCE